MNKPVYTYFLFPLALLFVFILPALADISSLNTVPHSPIFHIPLRIHLGKSHRPPEEWIPILEEINSIWTSQAGICFQMHTVGHDEELASGLDLWFEEHIPNWNGYFTGPHDIHVRDNPDLRPAKQPADSSAARTAAHELGHALSLGHRQNADDNLMRSKTFGWQLHADEIAQARESARKLSAATPNSTPCKPPLFHAKP